MKNFRSTTSPRFGMSSLKVPSLVLTAFAVVAFAYFSGGYVVTILSFALIYAVFVTGLNVFMGLAGQVSFGHNAFAAISGYSSAVLTANYAWEPVAAFGIGLVGALSLALIVGYPVVRLKGHYLAMATLAIGLVTYEVAVQWDDVTGGYMGVSGIPRLGIGSLVIGSDRAMLVLIAITAALAIATAACIKRSRLGRAMQAISGSEEAAQALGIDVNRYKLAAFMISAGYAAMAGTLFVHLVGFVSPEVFGLHMVVLAFTMLFVGGIGTTFGPLVGATIITVLPEVFRGLDEYQDLAYGTALILLLIYAPKGLSTLSILWRPRVTESKGSAA